MTLPFNEIRLDEHGKHDDIVIQCDSIHLEQMDNNSWWLGVYRGDKRICFSIFANQSGIVTQTQEDELGIKIVPLKKD